MRGQWQPVAGLVSRASLWETCLFLKSFSGYATACRTWHLRYACYLETASLLSQVSCLNGGNNSLMNASKRKDLRHGVRASIRQGSEQTLRMERARARVLWE
uniref:Putative secreted protein n=1 Tax=Ixodes ricinus TaxID=34613 RepID=A0A147BBW5_IXORI